MELLTSEGWNPINDIESVIVSIRSLLVVGDGRLEAAIGMPDKKREALLAAAVEERKQEDQQQNGSGLPSFSSSSASSSLANLSSNSKRKRGSEDQSTSSSDKKKAAVSAGAYSTAEAKAAYSHLSNYHKKKGWSGWWAKRG